jgi:PBS lyase HEAT-like repeat
MLENARQHFEQLLENLATHYSAENYALVMEQGSQIVPFLIEVLAEPHRPDNVRLSAANLLGEVGDVRAIQPLITLLNHPHFLKTSGQSNPLLKLPVIPLYSRLCGQKPFKI